MRYFPSWPRNLNLQPPHLRRLLVSVGLSVIGAGVLYSSWLAIFLLLYDRLGPLLRGLLWLSAPFATSLGFALGLAAAERLIPRRRSPFVSVLIWPLVGCLIGAGILYPFGAMLIVFGMFGAGTVAVAARELKPTRGMQR